MDTITRIKKIVDEVNAGYESYKRYKADYNDLIDSLEVAKERVETVNKARVYFQEIAETTQRDVAETLSVIITSAIKAVFDTDEYRCEIVFGTARNQSDAKLILVKGEEEIDDPLDSISGGMIDVAAFAARVGFIFLKGSRRVLIADEPFKGVSDDFKSRCPEMLRLLSEQLGMQFIIISHMKEMIDGADNVLTISNGELKCQQ